MDQVLDGSHNVPERTTYRNSNYAQLTSDAFSVSVTALATTQPVCTALRWGTMSVLGRKKKDVF